MGTGNGEHYLFFFKQIIESSYVSRATAILSMPSEVLTWNMRKQTVLEAG